MPDNGLPRKPFFYIPDTWHTAFAMTFFYFPNFLCNKPRLIPLCKVVMLTIVG